MDEALHRRRAEVERWYWEVWNEPNIGYWRGTPEEFRKKEGVRGAPDVSALASLEGRTLSVLAWHYHDDDVAGPDAAVELQVSGLSAPRGRARLEHYRIDEHHSNAYTVWKSIGSPQQPTPEQYRRLEAAGRLARMAGPDSAAIENGRTALRFTLPRQAVSLVVLRW